MDNRQWNADVGVCWLDESVIGGLSLLLMAGQHAATNTLSPVSTCTGDDRKRDHSLLTAVAVGSHDMQRLPCQVNTALAVST